MFDSPSILTVYFKSKGGGYIMRLCRMVEACADHGIEVHILTPEPLAVREDPRIHWHRALLFGPEWLRKGLALTWLPIQLLYTAAVHRIDALVVFGTFYAAIGASVRSILRKPVIAFLRGFWLDELGWRRAGRAETLLSSCLHRLGLRQSTLLVTTNRCMRDQLAGEGLDPGRITVLPNEVPKRMPVARQDARARLQREFGLPSDAFILSYVGTFKLMKRAWLCVDWLARLQNTRAHLLMVGDGADRERIERLIREKGLEGNCHMPGWVEQPDYVYAGSDLTLLPSAMEGSPNAVLESYAHGIPVLACEARGVDELVPPEHRFDPERPETAVTFIRMLMEEKDAQERAREIVRDARRTFEFDWDQKVATLILKAISGNTS